MYYYWAYGLTIASGIEFPELFPIPHAEKIDLFITFGIVPGQILNEKGYRSESISISPTEYLLHVKSIASYYVSAGDKILIQKSENADDDSIRLFCLSNAFAAVLHQRGLIPLHCSAFVDHGELVLIMGDSGAGKSTTLAAMVKSGYFPFSDDVCVPFKGVESNSLHMYSSYPMMKYWGDTLELLKIGETNRKIRPEIDKYGVFFHDNFIIDPLPVKILIVLEKEENIDNVVFKRLSGIDLFQRLERNAYRGEYLGYSGLQKEHFKLFSKIANTTNGYLLKRPTKKESISYVQNKIIELLQL